MDITSLSDQELNDLYNKKKAGTKDLSSMSDAELSSLLKRVTPQTYEAPKQEPVKEEPGFFGKVGRGIMRTAEQAVSSGRTGIETTLSDDSEKIAREAEERKKKISEKYPGGMSLEKITKAYEDQGFIPAAKEAISQIPEGLGAAVPYLAAGAAGARVGAMAGAPAGPWGAGIGAVIGGAAPMFLSNLGSDYERQFEAQAESGKAISPDRGIALTAAAIQSGLDAIPVLKMFGKSLVAPFMKIASNEGIEAAEKLAAESVKKSLLKGTLTGILTEVPTEVAQQAIERYQAGLDILSDDAVKEYAETMWQSAAGVVGIGGPARLMERGAARGQIAAEERKQEEAAGLSEEQRQYLAQRGAEAEQADIARQAQEKAEAEEATSAVKPTLALPAPPTDGAAQRDVLGRYRDITDRFSGEQDVEAMLGSKKLPLEPTIAEQRGDQFVVSTEDGKPVQGGFRTLEEAQSASDKFNARLDEYNAAQKEEEKKKSLGEYVKLANKISRAGSIPIYFGDLSTGVAARIFRSRINRQGEPNVLKTNVPFTTPQEIQALELNADRDLTVVQNKKDGRVELKSGPPKPDELNLSDRLLQAQEQGIDVAAGLTIPQKETIVEPVREEKKPNITPVAEKYLDSIQDRKDPTKFTPKNAEKVTGQLKSIAVKNDIDLKKTITKDGVESKVNKTPQDIVDELVQKRDRQVKLAGVAGEAPREQYGPQPRPPRTAEQIGFEKAQNRDKIKASIKSAFDRLGLTKQGVKPEVVSYIADASGKPTRGAAAVAGEFDPATKTITLASDIYDPNLSVDELTSRMMDIVNHEVVHALKQAGLFTPKEWTILENYVKNGDGRKLLERAKLQYPDLDMNGQIEEAIAEAAREFDAGSFKLVGAPRGLIKRIIDFFKGLFGAAKTANTTPDQIFNAIRTGEIGAREGTPQSGTKMQAKIGEAGTRNWTNQRGMIQTLGQGMYKENIGNVTAKELIQNAFDGIKSAQAAGVLVGPGKIVYDFNEKDRSITITDNGIGMDEETIKNAFFTVFGTRKRSLSPKDSSGGFGLAKLAYLIASEDLKLETTKDGVTYSVQTNGDEILNFYDTNSDIEVEKKNTPNKSNGTKVYIKLPESVVDTKGEEHKTKVDWPSILADENRKIIGNVEIYRKNIYNGKVEQVKGITDLSEFRPPKTYKFSWGEVDLYIGNKMSDRSYGVRPVVLSSGIYQFDRDIHDRQYKAPKVASIYNVKSYSTPAGITMDDTGQGRKVISSGYPFNRNRESFEEFVKADIENLDKIVWAESKAYEIAKDVKAMSSFYKMSPSEEQPSSGFKFRSISAPKTETGVNFEKIDVGVSDVDLENKNFRGDKSKFPSDSVYFHTNLNKDLIEEASSNPKFNKTRAREFFYKLGKIYHDFAFVKLSAVADLDPKYETYRVENNTRIVGVSLDKNYHGVNTVVPLTGMFINPFPVHEKLEGKIDSAGIAAEWGRIMLHEAAHEVAKNHNANFASEEIMLYSLIRQTERNNKKLPTLIDIEDRLEQLYNDYKTEYEAMKNVYDKFDTKNFSDSIGGNNEGVTELEERDRERRRESTGADDYGSRRQEVSPVRQEGSEVSGISNEEAEGINGQASNAPAISGEGKRDEVKQARLAARVGPVNISLNTPQQQSTSNEINRLLINNNKYLSKLTKEEGTRTSQRFMDYVKEFINPFHMLGAGANKYRIARALAVGNIAEMTQKVNEYVKPIGDAKQDKQNIYNYLTTRNALPDKIKDSAARKAAVSTKKLINDIGSELVRRGLISQKERDRFVDEYLPRVYLAYIDNKKHVLGGMKPSHQYYLESRHDLTEEQRAKLGEIDDPAFLVQEALFAPMRDIAILNFFEKINEIGQGQWMFGMEKFKYVNSAGQKVDRTLPDLKMFRHRLERMINTGQVSPGKERFAKDELVHLGKFISDMENKLDANMDKGRYVKVPKDVERFGPLAGVWVARPIYRDIMGMGSFIPNNMSEFAAIFADGGVVSKASSAFKIAKVAANPPTVITNIISNTLMMHFADVPMYMILPRISSVFNEIILNRKGKYYDIVHKYGLKETTLSEAELRNLYKELRDRQTGGSDLNKVMNLFYSLYHGLKWTGDKASNMYGMIETVFKAAIIKDAIERQGLSEEEAVLKANKYLFDYSEVHDSVKVLRNIPFGAPFLTWSYKMTPLLIETVANPKKWGKFLPYIALYAGMSAYAAASMTDVGGSAEDKDKLKKFLSKKAAENPFLLVTSPTDAFDFSKYMPFNNIYKFAAGLQKGDMVEALKAFGFFGGPIADIGVFALTGKDPFTNMDVFPKGASYDEKAVLTFNQLYNVFMPPVLKDLPRFAAGHGLDDPELISKADAPVANLLKEIFDDPTGKKPGMPTKNYAEIFANMMGFNIYHPSMAQYASNLKSFQKELTDLKTGMNTALKDPSMSNENKTRVIEKYKVMIKDKTKEMQDFIKESRISPEVMKIVTDSITGKARSS